MAFDPLSQDGKHADNQPLAKRLGWLVVYWAMGVVAVGAVGFLIRFWIKA